MANQAENEGTGGESTESGEFDAEIIVDETSTEDDDQGTGQVDDTTSDDDAEDSVVVTIGEETPPQDEEDKQPAPAWVKELRKADKEKARRIRELEQEKAELLRSKVAETAPANTQKPTLADCDFDEEVFEAKLVTWHEQQEQVKAEQKKAEEAKKAADVAWQSSVQTYETKKTELKVIDYEDCEAVAKDTLSVTQQGIIIAGAKNAALVMYALGKNPAKAKEFAAITDPVKFCFAIAELEPQLKVTPRKAPPPPDKSVRGGTAPAITSDAHLTRLEAEADKTGNRTKVIAYKRQLALKGKSE